MTPIPQIKPTTGRSRSLKPTTALAGACLLLLAGLPSLSQADTLWTGAIDQDWNNAGNWTNGVPVEDGAQGAAVIKTATGNFPIITAAGNYQADWDILIGTGSGTSGRLDQTNGTLATGDGNWMFLGWQGGAATYNLADTSTTGGAFTGFGQGSGSVSVGGLTPTGDRNLFIGLDNGTVSTMNVNTLGTVSVGGLWIAANGSSTGTLNFDGGTVNVSGECQIGSSFWGNGGTGKLNMSGGTFTANILSVARGNNNVATIQGIANITGGTINVNQYFTLGFAGSSSLLAAVTNNGGTINISTAGGGNLEMGVWDPANTRFVLNSGSVNLQNSGSIVFGVLGQSGTGTFEQNGGAVTFYSDAGTTVGGIGGIVLGSQGAQPWEISSGTFTYSLNDGTLTVPQISKLSPNASGNFNFNGGTLKAAGTTTTFLQGLTAANVQAGGAKIDSDGFDITIAQSLQGSGALTKLGAGTLTLSGTNTYTGNTVISNGTLALSGAGTLASTVVIPSGRTLDVTGLSVALQNPITGVGSINGSASGAAGLAIYPGTDGTAGTITFNNDLDLNAGGSIRLDLSTSHLSGNDQVVVSGNLTVSSATVIRIKALSGAANLSTAADYVLCSVAGALTMGSTPSLAWDGTPPANYLSFSVQQSGNNLVLHYTPAVAPTVTATSSPASLARNQKVTVTATVTPGSGSVTNVVVDASPIGGSATAPLILSGTPNVYTNTFTVGSSIVPGVKLMAVVATDTTPLSSPAYMVTNTVTVTNEVWTGAGSDNNWTTSPNWSIAKPADSGDAVTFAGTARLTPNLDANFSVTGMTFDPSAGSFNIGSDNGSTLTLTANGIVNLSSSNQVVNVPLTMSGAQTFNAAAGTLILSNSLDKAGNLVTVTGAANAVINGPVYNSGSLFKRGSGTLSVGNSATWDLAQASSGGFSGPFIAQAGTVRFDNGSFQNVTGELVIGGVITNGAAGNNAKVVVDNATLNVSSWLSVGRGNGVGGVSSDLVVTNGGVVSAQNVSAGYNANNSANLPKGSITLSDTSSLTVSGGTVFVGESSGSDMTLNVNGTATVSAGTATMTVAANSGKGALNINGGSVSVGSLRLGSGANNASTAQGTATVNTGTLSSEGDINLGFAGNASALGKLVINGGTVNMATATLRWFIMGQWDTANSQVDVNGGNLNINANSSIRYAINGNTGTNTINLNGGAITFYSDNATTVGGTGELDLHQGNGATVQTAFNLNGGTLTVPRIVTVNASGTRTFNFNGGTLKAAVDAVALMDLGAGNAHAYVRTNGAIIDTDGKNVSIATALEHFSGDATDGGLVKKGAGTLNLTGANSYNGKTVVQAGTLQLAQATLAATSTVTISNAATLQLDFGTTNQVAGLVTNGVALAPGVYSVGNLPGFIAGTGSLEVVSPINPNPPYLQMAVSSGTLTLSWPTNAGWILQAQTNSRALGLSTNWFDVSGSASVTSTNLPISPADPTVFYRMRKP